MWKLFLFLFSLCCLLQLHKLQPLILLQQLFLIVLFMPVHRPLIFGRSLLLCRRSSLCTFDSDLLELLSNFPQDSVNTDVRPFVEGFLTHRTLIEQTGFPVSQNAALTKVVSARDGHGVCEDVETNGAVHLLFGKVPSGGHSCTAERQRHFQHKKPGSERGIKPAVILRSVELDGLACQFHFHSELQSNA